MTLENVTAPVADAHGNKVNHPHTLIPLKAKIIKVTQRVVNNRTFGIILRSHPAGWLCILYSVSDRQFILPNSLLTYQFSLVFSH